MPATPAQAATKSEKKSGLAITFDSEWLRSENSAGVRPVARKISVASQTAVIAVGKPIASAENDRRATSRRLVASATQKPATGPNSGPTTIAPTIRIGELRKIPTEAISPATTMKIRNGADSSVDSRGARVDLLPDDGVARRPLRVLLGARAANSEICASMSSNAIEPRAVDARARAGRDITTLASSRATSQRITSPSGSNATPSR